VAMVKHTSHDIDLARVDGDDSGWVSFPRRGSSQEQLSVAMVSSSFLQWCCEDWVFKPPELTWMRML
jgi:hypothetical protein